MAKRLDKGEGIKKTIEITKNAHGVGALHLAAAHGRTDIYRYLIEGLGFDPNFRSNLGHGDSIEFLLCNGVPVDPENYRGTPLHVAAGHSQEKAIKILLEYNADVIWSNYVEYKNSTKSSNELFTLLMSIFAGSMHCTKILIEAGADINLNCPLATAIGENSAETVKCLLEAGADPNIPSEVNCDDYGKLPVEIAAESGKIMFVEMLLPVTRQLTTVPNWTVEGIIAYVKSPAYKKKFSDLF